MNEPKEPKSETKSAPQAPRPESGAAPQAARVALLTLQTASVDGTKEFRLHKSRIVIGSVVSADIRLPGDGVAPIHAVLEIYSDGTAMAYDLASETGVFVNDQKIVTQAMKPGDAITIGMHKLKFSLEELAKAVSEQKERAQESEGRQLFMSRNEDLAPLLLQDERGVEEIFDYRPTSKRALEVVMSWKGTILSVEHFVDRPEVTIGYRRDCHFAIPPILNSERFPLAVKSGDDFSLNLDAQIKGVLQRKGSLLSLADARATGSPSGHGNQVVFGKDDFCKLSIGEVDFYMSYTAAPPELKRRLFTEKDPFFTKIMMTSILCTALVIGALLKVEVPQAVDAEQLPERIATILYSPEKYIYKPKPEGTIKDSPVVPAKKAAPKNTKLEIKPNPANPARPVPKEMDTGSKQASNQGNRGTLTGKSGPAGQNEAKEGKGAKAKGTEGKRGSKTSKNSGDPQDKAARPSPEGGTGSGGSKSQIGNEGNVDFVKGAADKIENILGGASAQLGASGSKLKGFGGFTTQGEGGLALSGSGKGGGGTADSLGGLSDRGTGGGKVGTGMGAAGSGTGIVGGKTRVGIRTGGPEEAIVMGSIDAGAVEAALLAHRDEFRLCYERELNAENQDLAGRVSASFVIGASGRVTQAGIESSSLKNANTEGCILNVIRRIDFPIPRGGGTVEVTYPFKYAPTKQ